MANEYDDIAADLATSQKLAPTAPANEYDDIAKSMADTQYHASVNAGLSANPDAYAKARDISAQTGIPADVAERNPDEAGAIARKKEIDLASESRAVLRAQLGDVDFSKAASDDIGTLGDIGDVIGAGLKTLGRGYNSLLETMGLAVSAPARLVDVAHGLGTGKPETSAQDWMFERFVDPYINNEQAFAVDKNAPLAQKAAGAVGDTLSFLSQATLGGEEPAAAKGVESIAEFLRATLQHATKSMSVPALNSAIETGRHVFDATGDAEQALKAAAMSYTTTTAVGVVPMNAPGGMLKRLLQGAGVGVLTTEMQREAMNTTLPPELQSEFDLGDTGTGMTESALLAAILGPRAAETASAKLADAHGKTLDQLTQLAAESKLRERAPDLFTRYVDQVAATSDMKDVYIDAREVANALNQSGVAPTGELADQLATAVPSGGDIKLPIGQYLAMAGTDLGKALEPHVRTSPEAMSRNEAEVLNQSNAESMKAESERIQKENEDNADHAASVAQVEQTVHDQLTQANRFTPDVNKAYAAMVRDFYVTTAEKLGMQPHELYDKYPLRVTSEGLEGSKLDQLAPEHFKVDLENRYGMEGEAAIIVHDPETGKRVGFMDMQDGKEPGTKQIKLVKLDDSLRGQGIGQQMIMKAWEIAHAQGKRLVSDAAVSTKQLRAYEALRRKGWKIDYTDPADVAATLADPEQENGGATTRHVSEERRLPVVNNIEPPASPQQTAEAFPTVQPGETVDGRVVRKDVPNMSSIPASFTDYTVLPGVREVPMSAFDPQYLKTVKPDARSQELAKQITESNELNPLIVGVDDKGAYIVEGGHRFDALISLGAKSVPAIVVQDHAGETTLQQSPVEQAETPAFKAWAGTAAEQVIHADEGENYQGGPAVFEAFHGTTHSSIDVVDTSPASGTSESYLGKGFYTTTSREDASKNYGSVGPDLTRRIERTAEELGQSFADDEHVRDGVMRDYIDGNSAARSRIADRLDVPADFDYDELTDDQKETAADAFGNDAVDAAAKQQTAGDSEGLVMPVWVKFENPFDLRPDSKQSFEVEYETDAEGDIVDGSEHGPGIKLLEALQGAASQYGIDVSRAMEAVNEGGNAYAIFEHIEPYIEDPDTGNAMTPGGFLQDVARQAGFDGMIMDAEHAFGIRRNRVGMAGVNPGTLHMIPFEATQVKSALGNSGEFNPNAPSILKQGAESARGQIALDFPNGATISLLKNADLSTFLHESGHFFLEVYTDIAKRDDAPQAIKDDMGALLKWLKYTPEEWNNATLEQRRSAHEQFARGFEAYLFEGKAPTPELQSLFGRFRSWLLNVYKSLTQLDVKLTPEVRQVFDRMLSSEHAIKATEEQRKVTPMFTSAAEAGMTPEEWQKYTTANETAHEDAVDELTRRSVRDMQWASRARGRELKKLQADAAEKRAAVREEAAPDVEAEPIYAAQRFLKTGEMKTETGDTLTIAGEHKLDRAAVEGMLYSKDQMEKLEPYLKVDGLEPDHAAEMLGYTSGDHLMREMMVAPKLEDAIEAETDKRVLEKHGDLSDLAAMERAADEAVHNAARQRFVATELKALDRMNNARDPEKKTNLVVKAAKQFAETMVARLKIRDLKPAKFAAAETRAAKEANAALKAGKTDEAAIAKRNQLMNGHALRKAYDAVDEVERSRRYLAKFNNETTRKSLDPDYRDQIDALLERFDLRKSQPSARDMAKRKSLLDWVESQREMGIEPAIDEELLNEARRQPYSTLTVEQFRGLVDTVRNIEHLARLKYKLLADHAQRTLEAAVDQASAVVHDNAQHTVEDKLENNTWASKFKGGVAGFFAMHRKFASIVRQMSGLKDGGALWDLLVRPMNDAGNREARMNADATKALTKLFKPLLKDGALNGDKRYIPEIGKSLSKEGRLAVALNQGNETNKRRVLEGDKWSPSQVKAILDTLDKKDWDFVQGVWDHIDSYWPEIAAKNKRMTGLDLEKVEATPVETAHGTYRGGYYPIKYDPARSSRSAADTDAEAIRQTMQGLYTRATTRRGHMKARVETVERPMRKDLGVVFEHLNQVIHDLTHHEMLVDTNRILRSGKLDAAIREHYGPEYLTQMRKTLDDVAKGNIPAQNAFERSINYLRSGATVAGLGWNLSTALLQPIGLTQSMARIGVKHVARGLAEWMGSPQHMNKVVGDIYAKSDFMKLRAQTMQREIHEIAGAIHDNNGLTPKVKASFYYTIQRMQTVADVPTWLGQYHKSIEAGADEKSAVAQADQAVLDAQGGGQIKDLAGIQRGGPLQKLFTSFYSFFNTTYNLLAERSARTDFKKVGDVGHLAADFLLLYIVPSTLSSLLHASMTTTGDQEDLDKLPEQIARDNLGYMLGSFVGLREFSQAVQGHDYSGPSGLRLVPDTAKLAEQLKKGELDGPTLRAFLQVTGDLFHIPATQLWRTGAGIAALANGDTENPAAVVQGPPPAAH